MRTHSQPDNDFSRRHLLTGFHWRETRLDVSQEQPSVNRRNVMFLPISSSSMLPFARKKQSPSTRIKRDFSGSYQKFPSPRASPLLANKVPTDEEDGSPLTSEVCNHFWGVLHPVYPGFGIYLAQLALPGQEKAEHH